MQGNEVRRPSERDLRDPVADDALSSTEGSIGALVYCIDTKVQSTSSGECSIFQSSPLHKAASFSRPPSIVVEGAERDVPTACEEEANGHTRSRGNMFRGLRHVGLGWGCLCVRAEAPVVRAHGALQPSLRPLVEV
jgi:hypothetical protein